MRAVAALLALAVVAIAATPTGGARAGCPQALLPLARNAVGPAAAAALRTVPRRDDPQVIGATLAIHDRQRGPQARRCGPIVWRRTVVVYITRRAYLPALSAASGVYFVGRFRGGYRVWEIVH